MSEWKNDLEKYQAQIIGTVLISLALILAWTHCFKAASLVLLAVGGLDIFLIAKHRDTISQWIHRQFGNEVDFGVCIFLVAATWWFLGFEPAVLFTLGLIKGHLFWNGDSDE